MNNKNNIYDAVVIGGGFYGCTVALELRKSGYRVCILEKEADIMQKASYTNQARIHQGYHYPRSVLTARRSRVNFDRFAEEFSECIFSSFEKYYAIGKIASRINAEQFRLFCHRIGAPLHKAPEQIRSLFNPDLVEEVFKVREYAFDAVKLKQIMRRRLDKESVELITNAEVSKVTPLAGSLRFEFTTSNDKIESSANFIFNCAYSRINQVMQASSLPLVPLKHELTELALVEAPEQLKNAGFTIMDGPFFSIMPFPARQLHSLSHVRYTPHNYWQDIPDRPYMDVNAHIINTGKNSYHIHMLKDAQRYMPALADCNYIESLWEVKTVLPQSEIDDSRPILFRRSDLLPNMISIMGGKIDNIFDIREKLDMFLHKTAGRP